LSVDESNPLARMLLLSAVFMLMTSWSSSATGCSPRQSAIT